MIKLFGAEYDFDNLKDRLGDISVITGVKPYTLLEGAERGVMAIDVWSGPFSYTVIPDRGMDVCRVRYLGIPLDWISGTGITSPFLYDSSGWNWLKSFHGGLVHTCGLENVGEPCSDEAGFYGGHGSISNTPSRENTWGVEETTDGLRAYVTGKVRSVVPTEADLVLKRRISSDLGRNSLIIEDSITNHGFEERPIFLLYHCNFGFPFVSKDSILTIPAETAVDADGQPVKEFMKLSDPVDSAEEEIIHPLIDVSGREAVINLYNPRLGPNGLSLAMTYSSNTLPHLTIWKYFQKRSYVLAVEPGTCRVGGRNRETNDGRMVLLGRDESIKTRLEIGVKESC